MNDERGQDPKELDRRMKERAQEAFRGHYISRSQGDSGGGRWLLQRPYKDRSGWDWTLAADIVVMKGGRIVVWGDLLPVLFAHYGPFKDPVEVIHWMGGCEDFGHYVHEKATIGCQEVVDEYDSDVARFQLLKAIEERRKDPWGGMDRFVEVVMEAIDHYVEDGSEALAYFLYGQLGFDGMEGFPNLGMVISPRVYYAHAALARLSHLLTQEKEREHGGQETEVGGTAQPIG